MGYKNHIKKIAIEQGRTLTWVAKQVGTDKLIMYGYVANHRIPRVDRAIKIAKALGVKVEDLFTVDDN